MKNALFIIASLAGAIAAQGRSLYQTVDIDGVDAGRKELADLMQTNDDTITAFAATVAGWTNKPKIGQVVTIDADGTPAHWMLFVNDGDAASDWREVAIADSSDNFNLGSATISALVQNRTAAQVESLYTGAGGQSNQFDLATDTGTIYRGTGASTYEVYHQRSAGNVAWVSVADGNDTTAQVGSPTLRYSTIQAAIDAVSTGAFLYVSAGTYPESDVFANGEKNVVIILEGDVTIANGANPFILLDSGTTVSIYGTQYLASVDAGALIKTTGAVSPVVQINVPRLIGAVDMQATGVNQRLSISDCVWQTGSAFSGGMSLDGGRYTFRNVEFLHNVSTGGSAGGRYLDLTDGTLVRIGGVWASDNYVGGTGNEPKGSILNYAGGVVKMYGQCFDYSNTAPFLSTPAWGINASSAQTVNLFGEYYIDGKDADVTISAPVGAGVTTDTDMRNNVPDFYQNF